MRAKKDLLFEQYLLDGWICSCGEKYYDSEQAQRVLLQNKEEKEDFKDLRYFSERALKEIWDNKEDDIWKKYLKKN